MNTTEAIAAVEKVQAKFPNAQTFYVAVNGTVFTDVTNAVSAATKISRGNPRVITVQRSQLALPIPPVSPEDDNTGLDMTDKSGQNEATGLKRYVERTNAELVTAATAAGLVVPTKATKAVLVKLLEENDAANAEKAAAALKASAEAINTEATAS